jgi:2-polyprenyl-3-methyl-5-hydroxy-6-metoxy-1,4-benzoquinol methylase
MDPIPGDMRPFYAGGYQTIPRNLAELRAIAAKERYRLEPILRHKRSGRLLEVGPWMGIFSCNAKDAGFEVSALEIDPVCVTFLNETVGVRAMQSSDPAESLARMEETFDVIALWHCLEHLPHPWRVMQEAAKRLAPGGVLLIAIPNIESHEFRLFKGRWRHLDAPRHIYFYPKESLVELCRASGLAKLEVTTNDALSRALSEETWHLWALAKIPVKYVRGAVRRLGLAYSRYKEKKEDSGSGITAVFQRPS